MVLFGNLNISTRSGDAFEILSELDKVQSDLEELKTEKKEQFQNWGKSLDLHKEREKEWEKQLQSQSVHINELTKGLKQIFQRLAIEITYTDINDKENTPHLFNEEDLKYFKIYKELISGTTAPDIKQLEMLFYKECCVMGGSDELPKIKENSAKLVWEWISKNLL